MFRSPILNPLMSDIKLSMDAVATFGNGVLSILIDIQSCEINFLKFEAKMEVSLRFKCSPLLFKQCSTLMLSLVIKSKLFS